jgi:uncharacterized membrane protein
MPSLVRRRERGQTLAIAAVSMVALVGALAMVVDTGMFFVIQRHLQTAADAGALAGAWYDPICPLGSIGCLEGSASTVAINVARANSDTIAPLCPGGITVLPPQTGTTLIRPRNVNTIVVTVECEASYSFGRILGLSPKHISASAAAAIGDRISATNGDITDFTGPGPNGRIARLIE